MIQFALPWIVLFCNSNRDCLVIADFVAVFDWWGEIIHYLHQNDPFLGYCTSYKVWYNHTVCRNFELQNNLKEAHFGG